MSAIEIGVGQEQPFDANAERDSYARHTNDFSLGKEKEKGKVLGGYANEGRSGVEDYVDVNVDSNNSSNNNNNNDDGDDDDDLMAIRRRRLEEIKRTKLDEMQKKQKGHGELTLVDETEFLPAVTSCERVVCHFFSDDFFRCSIMNQRLESVARKHFHTKFIKINASKAPFFVARLAVRILPTVLMFIDGKVVDRLTGFEDLVPDGRAADDFTIEALERKISFSGVITVEDAGDPRGNVRVLKKKSIRRGAHGRDEFDLDDEDNSEDDLDL